MTLNNSGSRNIWCLAFFWPTFTTDRCYIPYDQRARGLGFRPTTLMSGAASERINKSAVRRGVLPLLPVDSPSFCSVDLESVLARSVRNPWGLMSLDEAIHIPTGKLLVETENSNYAKSIKLAQAGHLIYSKRDIDLVKYLHKWPKVVS